MLVDWEKAKLNQPFYRYPELGRAWVLNESFRGWYRGTNRNRVTIFTLIDLEPIWEDS